MSQQKNTSRSGNNQTSSSNSKVVRNSNSLLVGSHYKIGKRIGKGNFGEVRYGKDVKTNEDVAIKTVFVQLFLIILLECSCTYKIQRGAFYLKSTFLNDNSSK